MSEFLTKAQEQMLIYRLMIAKFFLSFIGTFFLAWQTAMAQSKWSKLDGDEKFYTFCCIGGLIVTNLIALTDKTAGQLQKGKLPIGDDGNTQQFKKDETKPIAPPPISH